MVDIEMLNSVMVRRLPPVSSYDHYGNWTRTITWNDTFLSENVTLGYIFILLSSILMTIGSIGNILVIGAVCVYTKLRTTGNVFIVNLALADLCITCVTQPFSIVAVSIGPSFFRNKTWLCHFVAAVCTPSCVVSVWTIAAIAVNRYVFLAKNPKYDIIFTWRNSIIVCFAVWLISLIVFEVPAYVGWTINVYDFKTTSCIFNRVYDYSYTLFIAFGGVAIPVAIVCISYVNIYLYVRKTKKCLRRFLENDPKFSSKRKEIQLAKTLFLIFVVLLLCWGPFLTLCIIDTHDKYSTIAYTITVWIAHTNSSINSVVYAATNMRFREGYKAFLCIFCIPFTNVKQMYLFPHKA